ncbi:MAG TPA: ATP synthase subunit I [Polyangiaceae bacterium]|jgi:hypothetical protein
MDARMRRTLVAVACTGGAFTLGAAAVAGLGPAFSVAVGALIAVGNLWALARIVGALLPGSAEGARQQSRAGWSLLAILKLIGLVGVVWLLLRHQLVSPIAMLIGFGSLPIGIALGSLVSDRSAPSDDRP